MFAVARGDEVGEEQGGVGDVGEAEGMFAGETFGFGEGACGGCRCGEEFKGGEGYGCGCVGEALLSISIDTGLTGAFGWFTVNRPRETVPTNLETVMGHGMMVNWLATPKL